MSEIIIENGVLKRYKGKKKSHVIPDGVTEIGKDAFRWHQSLQNIVISDSVTVIGERAFENCRNLQSITIPDHVTNIGNAAFFCCKNLRSITIPKSVISIGKDAFYGCDQIQKYVLIPGSVDETQCKTVISAFGTENLAYSFLSGNLETNSLLETLLKSKMVAKTFRTKYIPKLIEREETEIFIILLSLIKKMPPEEIDGYMELSVAQNTVEITMNLMEYRQKLYPPEKIEEMQEIEFEKAFGLREKTLSDYRKDFKIIKDGDFYVITGYKSESTTVVIPGNIKGLSVKWKADVFQYNSDIQNVFIEDGITEIDDCAFEDCEYLQSITIPDSVSDIGYQTFYGCVNLTIHAHEGSYAEVYAKENNIRFKAI